jgi:hypothetical protein
MVTRTIFPLFATSAALLPLNPAVAQFEPYSFRCSKEEGVQYINDMRVNISYGCCSETESMYDNTSASLKTEMVSCFNQTRNTIRTDLSQYCNEDRTVCNFDYDTSQCDEDVQSLCLASGGNVYESDVTLQCTKTSDRGDTATLLSYNSNNVMDCIHDTCSNDEVGKLYQAMLRYVKQVQETVDMKCRELFIDNVRKNGTLTDISIQKGGLADSTSGDDGLSAGATVGIVLAAVAFVAFIVIAVVLFLRRIKERRTGTDEDQQQDPKSSAASPTPPSEQPQQSDTNNEEEEKNDVENPK